MRPFLIEALGLASSVQIRSIPKTNLIFRVSPTQDDLRFEDGRKMKRSAALTEAKPFVERIIARVRPRAIILEGKTARSSFVHKYCGHVDEHIDGEFVETRL